VDTQDIGQIPTPATTTSSPSSLPNDIHENLPPSSPIIVGSSLAALITEEEVQYQYELDRALQWTTMDREDLSQLERELDDTFSKMRNEVLQEWMLALRSSDGLSGLSFPCLMAYYHAARTIPVIGGKNRINIDAILRKQATAVPRVCRYIRVPYTTDLRPECSRSGIYTALHRL
jgi:hypothetical protein